MTTALLAATDKMRKDDGEGKRTRVGVTKRETAQETEREREREQLVEGGREGGSLHC